MDALAIYGGLFLSAFLAATILPVWSEVALGGLLAAGQGHPGLLLLAATTGNVLGAVVNWVLGRYLSHFEGRKWFPLTPQTYRRAVAWYDRWGIWSLLLAWTPVIGDPLTVIAGALRVRILPFLVLVTIGKFGRYLFIVLAATAWFDGS